MLYTCGSITGNYDGFNSITSSLVSRNTSKTKISIVVCGDFGYDPDTYDYSSCIDTYKGKIKVFFVHGECDNMSAIKKLEDSKNFGFIIPVPGNRNIVYCAFGATKILGNRKCLFCGGANTKGVLFNPENPDPYIHPTAVSKDDLEWLPSDYKPAIIFSHTNPSSVNYALTDIKDKAYSFDPSMKYLSEVYRRCNPKQWFFGHWGKCKSFRDFSTDFVSVADINNDGFLHQII